MFIGQDILLFSWLFLTTIHAYKNTSTWCVNYICGYVVWDSRSEMCVVFEILQETGLLTFRINILLLRYSVFLRSWWVVPRSIFTSYTEWFFEYRHLFFMLKLCITLNSSFLKMYMYMYYFPMHRLFSHLNEYSESLSNWMMKQNNYYINKLNNYSSSHLNNNSCHWIFSMYPWRIPGYRYEK